MYQRKRARSRLNLSPVQPNLSSQHLLERLSPQSLPLLERLTPQSRSLQDRLSPQSRPLLERFEPPPLQDRLSLGSQNLPIEVPLPQRLAPRTKQSKAKARLRKKSLLERMNVELSSKGSSLSLLSTETDKSLKRRHSRASSPSSSGSRSPSPKRTRLSSFTLRSSSPSVETMSPTPHGWLEVDRSLTPLNDSITPQTPKTPSTDLKQGTPTIPMDLGRSGSLPLPTSPGMSPITVRFLRCPPVAFKPANASELTSRISRDAGTRSKSPLAPPATSLLPSGNEFLEAKPSTWTTSCPLSTALQLMKRERLALEMRESALASLTRNGVSVPPLTGPLLGGLLQRPYVSPFLTVLQNSTPTATILRANSQPKSLHLTPESLCSTSPCGTWSKEASLVSSPTTTLSRDSILPSSCRTEPNLPPNGTPTIGDRISHPVRVEVNPRASVTGLIPPSAVLPQTLTASTAMSASPARRAATGETSVQNRTYQESLGSRPKYLRYNLWNIDTPPTPTIAEWSETALPLPHPPLSETLNPVALQTIVDNPSLFRIVTPINVDRFQELLSDHPNPLFVTSVCAGLREGFWPWADTLKDGYPSSFDGARPTPSDACKAAFIREQRDIEIAKGRFSTVFGRELLPAMYSMPAHAVPKPNSSDLRMVTDHSAGPYSLNSMIDHDKVTGFPLDNMTHLGEMLISYFHHSHGAHDLLVWKSDVAEAHCLMPLHPLWQLKQVNTVDGWRYVDRNCTFGSSSSAAIFISFNSLIAWIAKNKRGIRHLATYADDSSGFDRKDDLVLYEPYATLFPRSQTLLLRLWDELSIPHKPKKQVFGAVIPIIGIDVDPNAMTLTLSREKREDLCDALYSWAIKPVVGAKSRANYQLKHWQRMGGWLNWAFNVFPLLRPCLNNFYPKLSGSHDPSRKIWVNNAIREDFAWAARHIEASNGVHLLQSSDWNISSADLTIYCDACPQGMGFWYPSSRLGFYSPTPLNPHTSAIFYFEALCVLCALSDSAPRLNRRARVVIFTDNLNTVQIFNSLGCLLRLYQLIRFILS